MEKARLDHISRLLEITERKRNHELLLSMKNLQELGASPFPYIVPILPRLLPAELVKGEHFILTDLLKLTPGSSSQVESNLGPLVRSNCLPLFAQEPKPAAEEKEAEMFGLIAGFAVRMRKRATSAQGKATPSSEGPDGKRYKQSGPAEEVQVNLVVISMDSPERAPSALSTLKGDTLGVS